MHPVGHNDSRPGLELRHVSTSVVDAQRTHQRSVATAELRHGAPRAVETMSAFLRQDGEFRQRHALTVLRRPFLLRNMVPLALALGGLVFMLTLTAWQGWRAV
jgi:hypothetical protein